MIDLLRRFNDWTNTFSKTEFCIFYFCVVVGMLLFLFLTDWWDDWERKKNWEWANYYWRNKPYYEANCSRYRRFRLRLSGLLR